MNNYNIHAMSCQEQKFFQKLSQKKHYNKKVIDWLLGESTTFPPLRKKATNIKNCATYVGVNQVNNHINVISANFCRERLCNVCAWRRQSRFLAQIHPLLNSLDEEGYKFIMVTLTVKNVPYEELKNCVDNIMHAYDKLLKRRKVKRAWNGCIRAMELTYNHEEDTFHPHLHICIAVRQEYFYNSDLYITLDELISFWQNSLNTEYEPNVDIKGVDDSARGAVEVIKYSLKPGKYTKCIKAFHYVMGGRRLVSFSGIFKERRKLLNMTDFENILTDDINKRTPKQYNIYNFDPTGGVYRFYKTYKME